MATTTDFGSSDEYRFHIYSWGPGVAPNTYIKYFPPEDSPLILNTTYFVALTYNSYGLSNNLGTLNVYIYDTISNKYTTSFNNYYKHPGLMGNNNTK